MIVPMAYKFWRNTRTEKHYPDIPELAPDPPPVPPIPPRPGAGCICEFCGCRLTSGGEIIKMGEVAKSVRKHESEVEGFKKQIDEQAKEIAALKTKIPAVPRRMPI